MDDKDVIDNSVKTETNKSETINSDQLDTVEVTKENPSTVDQENKESITAEPEPKSEPEPKQSEPEPESEQTSIKDTDKVKEPEKLELIPEKTLEDIEKVEDTTVVVSDPVQQDTVVDQPTPVSDQLLSTSDNLTESAVPTQDNLIEPTQDQIVPVSQDSGQDSLVKENQQVIPVSDSALNNDMKLDDNGVDLDQQSVLSMKDSELKDLVMRELSEFLTDEPSQNVGPPLLEIKPDFIKGDDQIKIENLENSLSKVEKADQKEEKKSENDIADALSTLATAALNQAPPTNGTAESVISKPIQPIAQVKQEGPAWCDVGVIKGTTCLVKQFYSTSTTDEHENTSLDHLPDYTHKLKIDIQPGTAYKLRIAAINTCGRGEWSEISAFKTCLPGYPGAPSAIKITKAPDGASLTWEAPPTSSGKILEYSVCLAIKNPKDVPHQSPKPTSTNLNFVRVYCGPHNAAVVSHESLGAALIDRTNKPAIIFRIAAKNEKGYGPATQVRWLQDSNVPGSNKNPSMKREKSVNLLTGVPKRPKM
ncbi:PREDICTED: host cell factor-like [Diuraphis noxia]|uniref:host cell factor-like n=1 Tax=Diuraphis noxia TaxID=143948 RepID=UPI000763887C|nr:PREDICTED: host cell factor-like [Diuraphis noxia]